jgi:7-keto-8-aminopelargonate synthetase-like enzyme
MSSLGVIICSEVVRQYIISNCRNFAYSSASPRFALVAIDSALKMLESEAGVEVTYSLACNTQVF